MPEGLRRRRSNAILKIRGLSALRVPNNREHSRRYWAHSPLLYHSLRLGVSIESLPHTPPLKQLMRRRVMAFVVAYPVYKRAISMPHTEDERLQIARTVTRISMLPLNKGRRDARSA